MTPDLRRWPAAALAVAALVDTARKARTHQVSTTEERVFRVFNETAAHLDDVSVRARMYVGAHLPLDVAAGFAIGVVCGRATNAVLGATILVRAGSRHDSNESLENASP